MALPMTDDVCLANTTNLHAHGQRCAPAGKSGQGSRTREWTYLLHSMGATFNARTGRDPWTLCMPVPVILLVDIVPGPVLVFIIGPTHHHHHTAQQ